MGLSAVTPLFAIEGGRISILGDNLLTDGAPPAVRVGQADARVVRASASRVDVLVPAGLEGRVPIRVEGAPGAAAFIDVGTELAAGLHSVDNPAFDRDGVLYATFSGTRSQQSAVSIYRIKPNRAREPFVSSITHPTGMTCGPDGALYVTDRFEGALYRVDMSGAVETIATDLGAPCGVTFDPAGTLYVGDRGGSIHRIDSAGARETMTVLPPSMAAYHLAWGPDECLYVSVPTLASHDAVFRVAKDGSAAPLPVRFGRPQGLAFDAHGRLHVVDALAGSAGVFRVVLDPPRPSGEIGAARAERVVAVPTAVGLAFDPAGDLVLASAEKLYLLAASSGSAPAGASSASGRRAIVKPVKP